tara:strand:+ start:29935 stop:32085 length:2151 start_codon:yes stop_codon:yes gene_type:complete
MAGEVEVDRMLVRLMGDGSSYTKMLKQAEATTRSSTKKIEGSIDKLQKSTAAKFKSIGAGMKRAGRTLSLGVTLPLVAGGLFATKQFSNFDKAMTNSLSIMKGTEGQFKVLRKAALDLSASGTLQQGPTELAEAFFFLASAGKDAEQSLNLLPTVSKFATAGMFDMAEATDLLTDAQSALGMSSDDLVEDLENMKRISNALVGANTLANASVRQFAQALTADAATASRAFDQSLESTVATLAVYADKGKKAAEAGNLYGRATRLMAKAWEDNNDEFEKRGIRVVDEATKKYRDLADIIKDMEDAFKGMAGPQRNAALGMLGFEALARKSILPLIGTSNQMKRYTAQLEAIGEITEAVANKQMKSFSARMERLGNLTKVAGIEIGEVLAPMIEELGDLVAEAVKEFRELSPEMKTTAVFAGIAAASLGPFLLVVGSLTTAVGVAVLAWPAIKAALAGITVSAVGAAVGLLALKVALIAAVAWGSFKFGEMLHGMNSDIIEFNKQMEKSQKLINNWLSSFKGDTKKILAEGELIVDNKGKEEFLTKELEKATKELAGYNAGLKNAQANVDNLNTFWNRFTGNKILADAQNDLNDAEKRLDVGKERVMELSKALKEIGDIIDEGTGEGEEDEKKKTKIEKMLDRDASIRGSAETEARIRKFRELSEQGAFKGVSALNNKPEMNKKEEQAMILKDIREILNDRLPNSGDFPEIRSFSNIA